MCEGTVSSLGVSGAHLKLVGVVGGAALSGPAIFNQWVDCCRRDQDWT
jgi:hypothetical protein